MSGNYSFPMREIGKRMDMRMFPYDSHALTLQDSS